MLLVACNQRPVQVTVKMDTPRDTVYVEKIVYKDKCENRHIATEKEFFDNDARTITKGKGKTELLKVLGMKCNDNTKGISYCESPNKKWVTIDDTSSTYVCKYNNGWKCSKGSKGDPLNILN